MLRPSQVLILFLSIWLLVFPGAYGAATPLVRELTVRDGFLAGPVTVTTVENHQTTAGLVTQTCNITLTPVTVNGQNMVQEDKKCKTSVDSSSNAGQSVPLSSTSPFTTVSTATTAESSTATLSSSSIVSSSTALAVATTASTSTSADSADSQPSAADSSQSNLSSPLPISSTGASSPTQTSVQVSQSSVATSAIPSTVQTSSAAASSAADLSNNSNAVAVPLPGKNIQVLPIGLGVFAGISVIALVVVGLVTYERTKYRKAFRQRKLAEQAGPLGFVGAIA